MHDEYDDREVEIVTSDEQINGLIARTEDEYNLFQQMDQEREKQEQAEWEAKGLKMPKPPR